MTVQTMIDALGLCVFALPDGKRTVAGGYTGDLLSWVMGRAQADEVWVTIMSNRNIVAVASLTDVACIVLAEGVQPDEGVASLALEKGVNLLGFEGAAFSLCSRISSML